jgi:hypothetical protein
MDGPQDGPQDIRQRELDTLEAVASSVINAVRANNIDELAALLEAGANPNIPVDNLFYETPVCIAAHYGSAECLQMLINAGVSQRVYVC